MWNRFALLVINGIVLLAVSAVCTPPPLLAEGISLLADLEYNNSDTETTNKLTGVVTNTDFDRLRQLYNLRLDKEIYPYLYISTGGIVELIERDLKSEGIKTENDERSMRPFGEINLTNPLYRAGFSYRTGETKNTGTTVATTKDKFEEYSGLFNWRPQDFPVLNMNYSRILAHDEPLTRDTVNETFNLRSRYNYKDLLVDYTYNQVDTEEKIADTGSRTKTHNAGMQYARDFYNHRLSIDTGARLRVTTTKFTGGGEVKIPTTSPGGSFYIANDANPENNVAADINRGPLTAVNIGQGGGTNPVSVGLEFDSPTEVDTVYVLLVEDENDPSLATPAEIADVAGSFTWRFFISDDQLDWTEQPLPSANITYNQVENRFEFVFTTKISTRFLKIRTSPLPVTSPVTGDIRFLDIQAFTTVSGGVKDEFETVNQTYNFGAHWVVSEKSVAGYDFNLRNIESSPVDTRKTTLTNGLSFRHIFNPIFVMNSRVSRTDISEKGKVDTVNYNYSASIRGDLLKTFNQTLIYSGTNTKDPNGSGYSNSLLLRSNADLYDGWSVFLDEGYSWSKPPAERNQTVRLLRAGTSMVPNQAIKINFDYSVSWNKQEGQQEDVQKVGSLRTLWVITETINVFANYDFRDGSGTNSDSTSLLDYAINWSPFPDGSLQFSFTYNETRGSDDAKSEIFTPSVKWQVAPGIFLDLRYNVGTIESEVEKSDIKNFTGSLRIFL